MLPTTDLEKLQDTLGHRFRNQELLLRALVHRSFAYENHELREDNETLEFLGDSVLGLAISHLLLDLFPGCDEGELSRLRSSIVNERELAQIASGLNLGEFLLLGKGEELSGGRQKPSLLANGLEAVLAAVYLDGGLDAALRLVRTIFSDYLEHKEEEFLLKTLDKDYKTHLQEITQAKLKLTPVYSLESEKGPDHDKTFFMRVDIGEQVLAFGAGKSKKEAQQEAARKAIARIEQDSEMLDVDVS
ncbi:MAG: ribonuclease III [Syntrophobacteraceae bacterium]|nr:ribonuclease III [Syntrophobacteraceae bacterium]